MWIDRDELVSLLGSGDGGEVPGLAASMLRTHGLTTEPPLRRADATTPVHVRERRALALQGVGLVAVAASAVGTVRLWIYGVLFVIAGLAAAALLAARWELADRIVPAAVPRGRWTGAVTAAALTIAAALLVALPIYASRRGWL